MASGSITPSPLSPSTGGPPSSVRQARPAFSDQLHEHVRPKYQELWGALHAVEKKYVRSVVLDRDGGTGDDYAQLVTTDPEIARKYDMHEESEFFGDDEG